MSELGMKIKILRKEHRITQRDLAEKVGIDFTYLSKIENGVSGFCPSEEKIIKMAHVLEADADELILLARKVPETIRETIVSDDLAAAFLRKVPYMTDEQREKFKNDLDEV